MAVERTLSIIKPDATRRNLTGRINACLEEAGLCIVAQRRIRLTQVQAEAFYAVHRERPFFHDLTSYMASGPAIPMLLQHDNAIQTLRDLMGATNPAQAAAGTLRQEFGLDVEKNALHGSDSPASAAQEVAFFFNHLEWCER